MVTSVRAVATLLIKSHLALDAAPLQIHQVLSTSSYHMQLANKIQAAGTTLC